MLSSNVAALRRTEARTGSAVPSNLPLTVKAPIRLPPWATHVWRHLLLILECPRLRYSMAKVDSIGKPTLLQGVSTALHRRLQSFPASMPPAHRIYLCQPAVAP